MPAKKHAKTGAASSSSTACINAAFSSATQAPLLHRAEGALSDQELVNGAPAYPASEFFLSYRDVLLGRGSTVASVQRRDEDEQVPDPLPLRRHSHDSTESAGDVQVHEDAGFEMPSPGVSTRDDEEYAAVVVSTLGSAY